MISNIPIEHILYISTVIFFIGVYGFLTRRNLITMLISVELMLTATGVNFAVINRFLFPDLLEGHFFVLFIIAIAAAEAAVGIALFINLYRTFRSMDVEDVGEMKY